jgi:hypothetical protein
MPRLPKSAGINEISAIFGSIGNSGNDNQKIALEQR